MAATMREGLAGKLAEVLTPGELAELAQLIGADPREHDGCARVCGQVATAALERGRAEGWLRCLGEIKALDAGLLRDLRQERVRWRRLCVPCSRAERPRPHCKNCQPGTRATFGQPVPGEYQGGPVPAW